MGNNVLRYLSLNGLRRFWKEDRGVGILEILLIIAVILVIAVLFRGWITDFLQDVFSNTESQYQQFHNSNNTQSNP